MSESDLRPSEQHIRATRRYARALLPALREAAEQMGYALTVHGSMERDIDVVAVPWADHAIDAEHVADRFFSICRAVCGPVQWNGGWEDGCGREPPSGAGPNPTRKPHGRLAWSIMFGGGPYLDLSVTPRSAP